MSGRKAAMAQPINVIFKYLQSGQRIQIWLYDNLDFRLEGKIIGFDEFMNVVLDDSEEVWLPKAATESKAAKESTRKPLGRILLKGENITLMQTVMGS